MSSSHVCEDPRCSICFPPKRVYGAFPPSYAKATVESEKPGLTAHTVEEYRWHELAVSLLCWTEMLIEANVATGHFAPHGYVHDQACRECKQNEALRFRCAYHRTRAALGESPGTAPSGANAVAGKDPEKA